MKNTLFIVLAAALLASCASLKSAPVSQGKNKPSTTQTAPVVSGEADTGPTGPAVATQPAPTNVSFRFESYETFDAFNYGLQEKFPVGTHLNVVGRALLKAGAHYLPKSQDPSPGHNFFYASSLGGRPVVYTVKVFVDEAKLVTRINGVFDFARMSNE